MVKQRGGDGGHNMKILDPEGQFILQWNKFFLVCSVIALSLDPLFFYIPVIDGTQKCLSIDQKLKIFVCILRSFADILYVVHIVLQFRTGYMVSSALTFGMRNLVTEPSYIARRYLKSYFIIDALAALPLPQLAVLIIIPNADGPASLVTKNLLKFIIFSQFVPRLIRVSLFYKEVTKISGFLTERAWAGAAFNFFLYVLASHVVGALWYLFALERELACWNLACDSHTCYPKYLYCGEGRVGDYAFLNTSCPLLERSESTNFDFGIFLDALQTRVVETRDFRKKFFYCSWWGLQSLSSLGQNLKSSTSYEEILFADFIAIIGLVLFSLLIGNMQKYLQQSFSNHTQRVEEMKEKRREAEELMSYICLPEDLRQRVRKYKRYKWKKTRGVELDSFVRELPRDLRSDIKRHLCLPLIMRVPLFESMGGPLLDAVCDRLKPCLYTETSYIVQEGDQIHEMLFITRGELLSITTDGGRTGFFSSFRLKAGDFCGEELLTWGLDPSSLGLPISTRTVRATTDVEAFALMADDLKFVASQFRRLHSRQVQHIFRFYSQQWRTWAACFIQAAWRRHHKKRKIWAACYIQAAWHRHCERKHKALREEEKRLQTVLAIGSQASALPLRFALMP